MQKVHDDMISSNTKMANIWVSVKDATTKKRKPIHGGAGYSGIVATACASVTNKARNPIAISICAK